MPGALDGNGVRLSRGVMPENERALLYERVETALESMANALTTCGWNDHDVGVVNLATRFAITGVIKERARG